MIVEVKKGRDTFYMKAEVPDRNFFEMEARLRGHHMEDAPEHPSEDLNRLRPATKEMIVASDFYPDNFQFCSEEEFDALPTLGWGDIMRFAAGR